MSASASQAQIEAATAYEAQFVPALFRPWASFVADLARITAGDRVLDIACGWLPVMEVVLPELEISLILAEAENVLAPYVARDGALAFNMSAHLVSSRKP
jgi:hypothetical protein